MSYTSTLGARRHVFRDLKTLLAKASPARSGDMLAGLAAGLAGFVLRFRPSRGESAGQNR